MLKKEIAVIGISGIFPDAHNIYELYYNLLNGKDSVSNISEERLRETRLPLDGEYICAGFLKHIGDFDHKYFNISKAEANAMDPHQRILLQCMHHVFENAGYRAEDFAGSDTAVFVADMALDYYKQATHYEPTLSTGNTNAFTASRISRQFGLQGTSMMIDTTCSSSLLAVHLACNELILGDAETAIACGANILLYPMKSDLGLGLESPDGKSKAFSDKADGMSVGEAVGCVLLKSLEKAIQDKDNILAVIKGSASNNNANFSGSLTAPDSIAQSKVILRAWEKAGISPIDIGFIETHGSGTQLGDSVEIGGLNIAFARHTSNLKFCPISTIKSNIGHTRTSAGIVGFIKTVLSINRGILFPTIHFDKPNPVIDFENSPVYVNTKLVEWREDNRQRLAGVSSIGLSGTNVHVVVEQTKEEYMTADYKSEDQFLFLFSSLTRKGLRRQISSFGRYLQIFPDTNLQNAVYTLATGRSHYPHRFVVKSNSYEDLTNQLYLATSQEISAEKLDGYVLLLEDIDYSLSNNTVNFKNSKFKASFNYIENISNDKTNTIKAFSPIYATYKVLIDNGIRIKDILSLGVGKIAAKVVSTLVSPEDTIQLLRNYEAQDNSSLENKLDLFISNQAKKFGRFGVISIGKGNVSNILNEKASTDSRFLIHQVELEDISESILDLIQWLYMHGFDFGNYAFKSMPGCRIDLPGYEFEPTYCWIRDTIQSPVKGLFEQWSENELKETGEFNSIERYVEECWRQVLNKKSLKHDQSFFTIGGDSLKATKVINQLNAAINISLDFEDIFDFQTIEKLSDYISNLLTTEDKLRLFWKKVLKIDQVETTDNFFDLGGHSLLANQVINFIASDMQMHIDFDVFFRFPTIQSLAEYLESGDYTITGEETPSSIGIVPLAKNYELSINQQHLWLTCQRVEGMIAYSQPNAYSVNGFIDFKILQSVFKEIVARHEILRTTFTAIGRDPRQVVHIPEDFDFNVSFLRMEEDKVDQYMIDQSRQPFDLEKGPLLFVALIELSSSRYILYINIHHLISDGWSMRVLTNEFYKIYKAKILGKDVLLPDLPVQYKDYAVWNNERSNSTSSSKLKERLLKNLGENIPQFKIDKKNKDHSLSSIYDGTRVSLGIEPEILQRIISFASNNNLTLFSCLVAFVRLFLYRNYQIDDLVIGIPFSGRNYKQTESLVGYFVNIIPVRLSLYLNDSFVETGRKNHLTILNASACQSYPLPLLSNSINIKKGAPLFNVVVVLQDVDFGWNKSDEIDAFEIRPYEIKNEPITSKCDLRFEFILNNGYLLLNIDYPKGKFLDQQIVLLKRSFPELVQCLLSDSNSALYKVFNHSEEDTSAEKYFEQEF